MTMRAIAYMVAALALPPSAIVAQAPEPADDANNTIIVEGQRLTRKEVRERATGFVRTLGVVQGERSVARWVDGVCPRVLGVAPEIAKLVEAKVRKITSNIGAPLADERCHTNLLIAFVENGRDIAKLISTNMPNAMSQVHGIDRRDLEQGDAPIRWWYTIGDSASTGGKALDMPPPGSFGNSEGGGSALPTGVPTVRNYSSSLVRPATTRSIDAATVVIDVNRAEGISLTAASAYAAFVGLAEIKGRAKPPVSSILNIFGEKTSANDLTFWDSQFLDELYDMPLNRWGRVQRGYLVKAIGQAEGEAEDAEDGPVEP